jgi:hypothetical protein
MYATVRQYRGLDPGALDEIQRRRQEIEAFVRGLPGLVSWHAFRTGDGMSTVTISDDRATADETVRQVAAWIKENMPTFLPNPPEVSMGEVIGHTAR